MHVHAIKPDLVGEFVLLFVGKRPAVADDVAEIVFDEQNSLCKLGFPGFFKNIAAVVSFVVAGNRKEKGSCHVFVFAGSVLQYGMYKLE